MFTNYDSDGNPMDGPFTRLDVAVRAAQRTALYVWHDPETGEIRGEDGTLFATFEAVPVLERTGASLSICGSKRPLRVVDVVYTDEGLDALRTTNLPRSRVVNNPGA